MSPEDHRRCYRDAHAAAEKQHRIRVTEAEREFANDILAANTQRKSAIENAPRVPGLNGSSNGRFQCGDSKAIEAAEAAYRKAYAVAEKRRLRAIEKSTETCGYEIDAFGAASNASALIDQPYQFDYYDGGGLDATFLGLAEVDRLGNVNVSKFGTRLPGAGGFVNISQNAKKIVFLGTFTAGRPRIAVTTNGPGIVCNGSVRKFVDKLQHTTFSSVHSRASDRDVLYITERCVFKLTADGLELIEVSPGIDIERDVLALMDFKPIIRQDPAPMDDRVFAAGLMRVRHELLYRPLASRFIYDQSRNLFLADLARMSISTSEDVDTLISSLSERLTSIGNPVHAIENYEGVTVDTMLLSALSERLGEIADQFYIDAARHTTSANFNHARLRFRPSKVGIDGAGLQKRAALN